MAANNEGHTEIVKALQEHGAKTPDTETITSIGQIKTVLQSTKTEKQSKQGKGKDVDDSNNNVVLSLSDKMELLSSSFAQSSSVAEPFVELHGLAIAKELNGNIGRRGAYSSAKSRYLVHFDDSEPLWIKDANMTIIESGLSNNDIKDNDRQQQKSSR